jgi:hypothetical protein
MQAFASFNPHLVGPVEEGTAYLEDAITLHIFADTPEEVILALVEQRIPWVDGTRTMRYGNGELLSQPLISFFAGDIRIDLVVLPLGDLRAPPLSPLTDRPVRGADRKQLEKLLAGPVIKPFS